MPAQHPFDRAPKPAKAPTPPMDPRDRLRRFGKVMPMEQRPSLLERLLFF